MTPTATGVPVVPRAAARAARRTSAALGRLLLGCGLVAVALGVGLPRLVERSGTASSLAATAALAGGLWLWITGLRGLVPSVARRWRWAVVPALVLGTALTVYVVAVPFAVVTWPRSTLGPVTPADRGRPFRALTMTAPSGEVLAGWYVPSRNGAAVVVRHGSGSSRTAVLDQAVVLARHGYGVLLTDARGQGESTGHAMAWGWHGDDDLSAAVSALAATPGVDPRRIAVLGLSMGGEEALGAAGGDPRIAAVVGEGVTGRSAADLGWLRTAYGWRGAVTLGVHRAQTALVSLLAGESPPRPLAESVRRMGSRPVLLVVAGREPDEELAGRALAAAAPGDVQLWVVPGAGHVQGLRMAPSAWERRVVGFLDAALPAAASR